MEALNASLTIALRAFVNRTLFIIIKTLIVQFSMIDIYDIFKVNEL
jgi:hypothetical protein